MPKKTTILIIILAIITGVLIFLAVRSDQSQELGKKMLNNSTPTPIVVRPFASLALVPSLLDVSNSIPTKKADIVIDTHGKTVSGVQVELTYDPKVITNVSLTSQIPNQFFGSNPVVLINSIDQVQGRISYAVAVPLNSDEKKGTGSIGTLTFTVNKFAGVPITSVDFLPKSAVTTSLTKGSVLDTTTPLKIIVTKQPSPTTSVSKTP